MTNYYSPKEMAQHFAFSAEQKIQLPVVKFLIVAILGGAFIAFGGLLSVMVAGGIPEIGTENPGLVKFIAGALFPIGLIMVSMTGADLFTSDCAAFTFGLLGRNS
jgi:Formate/nitrite family of transporters